MEQDKFNDINKSEVREYILHSFENFLSNFIVNKDTLKGIISLCRVELEGKPKESEEIKGIDSGRRNQLYPPIKEYEVLEYQNKAGGIVKKAENGMFYFTKGLNRTPSLEMQLRSWNIFSVRRTSDGEIFSVDDNTDSGKICGFTQNGEVLFINYEGTTRRTLLAVANKCRTPILTTVDGKDIYKDDSYYYVDKYFEIDYIQHCYCDILEEFKTFSTKKAAESYINLHKKRFSLKDVHEAMFLGFNQTLEGAYNILKNKPNE